MARSAGVTISAVVVFIGCGLTVLFGLMMLLGSVVLSHSGQALKLPGHIAYVIVGEAVLFFGFAGWGIATGVNLIRTRQWARISMLVFAGLLILFSLPAILVMAVVPIPNTSAPGLPADFGTILRVGMMLFYGMFAALGGIWLYFFNRRSVKEQFAGKPTTVGGPAPELSLTTQAAKRSRPISITIIGWFLIACSILAPIGVLTSLAMFPGVQLPMCLLGVFLVGRSAMVVLLIWMAIQLAAGVGLLRLENWGRLLSIGLQCLAIANGVILVAVPSDRVKFRHLMDSMVASMNAQMPQPVPFVFPPWAAIAASTPIVLVILWFLITRKQAFMPSAQQTSAI